MTTTDTKQFASCDKTIQTLFMLGESLPKLKAVGTESMLTNSYTVMGDCFAWDGTTLFMATWFNSGLYSVDRNTGVATRIGDTPRFGVNETNPRGLAWNGSNLILLGSTSQQLYTVNAETGIATAIESAVVRHKDYGDIDAKDLVWDGKDFLTLGRRPGCVGIYKVDIKTGVATRIGKAKNFGMKTIFPVGILWDGESLYIATDTGDFYIISRDTGKYVDNRHLEESCIIHAIVFAPHA